MKQMCFSYFGCGFKIKTSVIHEHVMNSQEQVKNAYENLRTFKHIQGNLNNYYHALILNSHHDNAKNKLGKGIIPSCMIHTVDEETLCGGSKGGGKEELG